MTRVKKTTPRVDVPGVGKCTRDAVLVSVWLEIDDMPVEDLLDQLQPDAWTATHIRCDWDMDGPCSYHLEGFRKPTPEELEKIKSAWTKRDAKDKVARERLKARRAKEKEDKEKKERSDLERLKKKYES